MSFQLLLIIIIACILLFIMIFGLVVYSGKSKKKKIVKKINKISNEDKFVAIDELRRYLRTNPDDYETRDKLIKLLFEQEMYLPAVKECLIMINASASHSKIEEIDYTVKVGEAHYFLKNIDDAQKYFNIAKKIDDFNFKANFYLGKIQYDNQNYEKAIKFFNNAVKSDMGNIELHKLRGICSYHLGSYREAIASLSKVLKNMPLDNDSLFYSGKSYASINQNETAKKYLLKLTADPAYQVEVQYTLGSIFKKEELYMKAIESFDKAVRSKKLKPKDLLEAYHSMAECYIKIHEVAKALRCFEEIARINPNYKDVQKRIETYSQLNKNSLLEKYLIGSSTQFTNICKYLTKFYISKYTNMNGTIKYLDTSMNYKGELEFYIEITSNKFVAQYYFIYFRTNSTIGELEVRNIYNMLREKKIDKGICMSAGDFSETAKKFIESRMLEVVEKKQLLELLNQIGKKLDQQRK